MSSPMVNVLWGTLNAAVGYLLVCHVGEFHVRLIPDALALGAGGLLMAVMLSRTSWYTPKPMEFHRAARRKALSLRQTWWCL
jgi:hypothetical protein